MSLGAGTPVGRGSAREESVTPLQTAAVKARARVSPLQTAAVNARARVPALRHHFVAPALPSPAPVHALVCQARRLLLF